MTAVQLDLFATDDQPESRRIWGITVCFICGVPIEAVPIDDPADCWQPAVLFGYVAQKAHDREHHPERAA